MTQENIRDKTFCLVQNGKLYFSHLRFDVTQSSKVTSKEYRARRVVRSYANVSDWGSFCWECLKFLLATKWGFPLYTNLQS